MFLNTLPPSPLHSRRTSQPATGTRIRLPHFTAHRPPCFTTLPQSPQVEGVLELVDIVVVGEEGEWKAPRWTGPQHRAGQREREGDGAVVWGTGGGW